jgi:GAF domain-containing protein
VQQIRGAEEHYDWVGIYLLEDDVLILHNYIGKATDHTRIPVGQGVCGTAVAEGRDINVPDVHAIANYLACSLETVSELVVLIRDPESGEIFGQLDLDSHRRFRRLQAAGTAYVTLAVTRTELFRLMFSGRWTDRTAHPELQEEARLAFGALQEMMLGAMGQGDSQPHVDTAARAAWAMVHGIAMLLVDGRIDTPPGTGPVESAEQLARELTTVLGKGLRSLQAPSGGGSPSREWAGGE